MDAEVQRAVEEFQRATQNFAQVMSSMSSSVQQAATSSSSLASASSSASSSLAGLGRDAKYAGSELMTAATDGSAAMQGYNRALTQTTNLLASFGRVLPGLSPVIQAVGSKSMATSVRMAYCWATAWSQWPLQVDELAMQLGQIKNKLKSSVKCCNVAVLI